MISQQGDAPTIESNFYIFFGYVEVKFRAANGTGIVSTSVMESNDLDEIDWVRPYQTSTLPMLTLPRSKSVHGTQKSKRTTSAKATPRPTTVPPL